MIKIGMVIGGRYEIVEKIGTGGMSDVYKAKDHKLNRFVAVKVLKQEFSENTNFVSKFRTEAQATAGLMHPNIVNVYDVGDEAGIYYIVMELVEGITLKKYIEKKIKLTVKEAISIAIQVSMGIEAAHNNKIIHRDIKPQNIIISKDGKVKVADFGIAKAASSNTITSNVMGSVHYTSPEQARGGFSDEKSDIYSLGVTIFEMVTGRVPFTGETTVAIAIKHIQEQMPSPREFVPDIPISVEKIILKCTKKSPDHRYKNMASLIEDLKHSLIEPEVDFVVDEEKNYEELGGTKVAVAPRRAADSRNQESRPSERRSGEGKANDKKNGGKNRDINSKSDRRPKDKAKGDSSTGPIRTSSSVKRDAQQPDRRRINENKKSQSASRNSSARAGYKNNTKSKSRYDDEETTTLMDHVTTILAVIAAVIVGCVVLFTVAKKMGMLDDFHLSFMQSEDDEDNDVKKVKMPDVTGTSLDRARTMLEEAGLTNIEVEYEASEDVKMGVVIGTNVKPGRAIAEDTEIVVKVSSGKEGEGIAVVDVIGMTSAEATATLEREGFVVEKQEVKSEHVEPGLVCDQTPGPEDRAPRGSTVIIKISAGMDNSNIEMPNLKGMTEMDATVLLTEKGLSIASSEEVNTDDAANIDVICEQSIEAGTLVPEGTQVDVKINIGPAEKTYSFNSQVDGPQAEDPSYKSGTRTHVILTDASGKELFRNENVTSFPIAINVSGIKGSDKGTITFQYISTGQATSVTNPETGEVLTQEGEAEAKSVTRAVSFSEEN